MKNLSTINIIGGGIAGLATALSLETVGISYNLFEQRSEITYENVGLGISANVFPILEKWNILKETKEVGTEIRTFHFVDNKLNYINSFNLRDPALSVNRKLFYQILNEHLDKEKLHLNSTKFFNDFPETEIVISADGIYSQTRQTIYPKLELRNANQTLWRGISEIELDDKFKNAYYDFVGGNLRFAIIHTGKNYYSWYAIKQSIGNADEALDKAKLKILFKDYHPIVKAVIDNSEKVYFSKLLDINPKKRKDINCFRNKIVMIGDVIHPTTPNMANGACLAMEDAYLLANLLNNGSLTLEETFLTFQKQRTKKVDTVVFQSWWLGKLLHQKHKVMNDLVKLGIVMTPQFLFNKIYSNVLKETKVDTPIMPTN